MRLESTCAPAHTAHAPRGVVWQGAFIDLHADGLTFQRDCVGTGLGALVEQKRWTWRVLWSDMSRPRRVACREARHAGAILTRSVAHHDIYSVAFRQHLLWHSHSPDVSRQWRKL